MRYLLFITLAVVCYSCNKQKVPTSSFKTYHIENVLDMKSETLWLDSICDSITIIPLETSDEILMNGFVISYLYNNLLFITHTSFSGNDRLSVFDLSGKYLWDIGRRGQGPGEYNSIFFPKSIFFNDNKIYVYNKFGMSVLCYTLTGEFIKKTHLPYLTFFHQFTYINKDVIAGFVGVGDVTNSRVLFINDVGELIDSVSHYKTFEKKIYTASEHEGGFLSYNGRKYIKEARYSDTVFRVTEEMKLLPEYCISTGKYKYKYEDLIGNNEIIGSIKFVNVKYENNQFIVATGFSVKELFNDPMEGHSYILIDKESSSSKKVRFYYSEETCRHFLKEKVYINPSNFRNSPGVYIEPPKPRLINDGSPTFRISNVSEDNTIWIGAEKALNNDDNPVIVLVHLKK